YPLYEDVAYSRRLEVVPFDPELYPEVNSPELGVDQEHPARLHDLDDSDTRGGTDTQAYITHNDELILLVVRGTASMAD
ncbi:lipase family protein, partial [Pseudomonas aeruginosa]|nr:lipase family protein [Pseudomonas aeruginosa]